MESSTLHMPSTMERLKRFLPARKQEQPQQEGEQKRDPAEVATDQIEQLYLASSLKRGITTVIKTAQRTEQERIDEMVQMYALSFALRRGMDVEELKARMAMEAEDGTAENPTSLIWQVAKFIGKNILGRLLRTAVISLLRTFVSVVLRGIVSFIGRLILRYVVVGLASVVGSIVSVVGLPVVLGGLAIGGAGLFIYQKFFRGGDGEVASPPSAEAREPGSIWRKLARRFFGFALRDEDAGDIIRDAMRSNTIAPSASREVVPITEEMKKRGLALLKYRTQSIADVIHNAAVTVGESEPILTSFAAVESAFNPDAGASTTSAKGLFQFVGGTWTATVNKYGEKFGVDKKASVFDATANALMGAAYLKYEIRPSIERVVQNPNATDLYLGHFLGPAGGARFLRGLKDSPNDFAYKYVDAASVRSNKTIFFNKDGTPKTLLQIYSGFAGKLSPIEDYMKNPQTKGASSTSSVPVGTGALDTKTATYEAPTIRSNENDLFGAMSRAQDREAGALTTAPPDKDYVKARNGKIVTVKK